MPAPTALCLLILEGAQAAEVATPTTGGRTYLSTLRDTLLGIAAAGGTQLTSASGAGKAYTYAVGFSIDAVTEAYREASGIWNECTAAQIARMLGTRPRRETRAVFC